LCPECPELTVHLLYGKKFLSYDTNYRDVKLHAHDEIALIYGTPPANIPSRYDFPQGL
jgi:hypothetical protein